MGNFSVKNLLKKLKADSKSTTYMLIYACVLVWAIEIILYVFSKDSYQLFIENTAFVPSLAFKTSWTWFTSMFVHSISIEHIFFNMLCLYSLGLELERFFGRLKFFFLYALCGLGGSAATILYCYITNDWNMAAYGASGAIMGLIGALLVAQWKLGQNIKGTLIWIAITLALPIIIPRIAWQAHLGGLVVGIVLSMLLVTHNPILKNCSFNKRFTIYSSALLIILLAISMLCLFVF